MNDQIMMTAQFIILIY